MIWTSRLLRAAAVAIAILAAIDPSLALRRAGRPLVAVIDSGSAELTARLSRALSGAFDVHAGAIAGAAVTILAGDRLPIAPIVVSGALFAVMPTPPTPRIEVSATLPVPAPSGAKLPVTAGVRAVGMRGRTLVIDLYAGALAVDTVKRPIASDDERADVTLALPPAAAGLLTARVVAHDAAQSALSAERHVLADVRDQRWRVFVADARPSWTSTFVRRALELDRRFEVVSRVSTSKGLAAESGAVPSLADSAALANVDAVVIGAPEAMAVADVRALERFARERGGSIVLLVDEVGDAGDVALGAADALLDGVRLDAVRGVAHVQAAGATGTLVATEMAVPRGGRGVTPLARASIGGLDTPVVWQTPLGAGRVIVNGALDAWRYRTSAHGGFARFWSDAIGAAAAASPAPLAVTLAPRLAAPGQPIHVRVVARDAQLSDPTRAAPVVTLKGPPDFWPDAERGVFRAVIHAPDTPGNYELRVDGLVGAATVSTVVHYAVTAKPDDRPAPATLSAWTTAHGGAVLGDDLDAAVARVRAAAPAPTAPLETHPMRSAWWLPVFVLLLGGEWWIRRRRGER